jgi:hypothetical protein
VLGDRLKGYNGARRLFEDDDEDDDQIIVQVDRDNTFSPDRYALGKSLEPIPEVREEESVVSYYRGNRDSTVLAPGDRRSRGQSPDTIRERRNSRDTPTQGSPSQTRSRSSTVAEGASGSLEHRNSRGSALTFEFPIVQATTTLPPSTSATPVPQPPLAQPFPGLPRGHLATPPSTPPGTSPAQEGSSSKQTVGEAGSSGLTSVELAEQLSTTQQEEVVGGNLSATKRERSLSIENSEKSYNSHGRSPTHKRGVNMLKSGEAYQRREQQRGGGSRQQSIGSIVSGEHVIFGGPGSESAVTDEGSTRSYRRHLGTPDGKGKQPADRYVSARRVSYIG